ncbi:MAG: (deoxy)nucleoside triphosphate pyrophosphohydrolase [Solobacterium sp.]|nr:(deoxy)nucleoside triphosphate pyrophosphohydrolase [Solobacterium sp.]
MTQTERKTLRVTAAVIVEHGQVFAVQRGYGEYKDKWEFPGGKIEAGETPQEALHREILEELDTDIEVLDLLDTIETDYPAFHLSMDCFLARIRSGDLFLKEAEDSRWLSEAELDAVDFLPADRVLLEKIRPHLKKGSDL